MLHTPGPWKLLSGEYEGGMSRKVISGDRDPRGASTFYAMIAGDAPCREANALLISEAPNMLTALVAIALTTHHIRLDGKETHSPDCPPCVASAAVLKATAP